MPRSQPSWLPPHSKRSICQDSDQLNKAAPWAKACGAAFACKCGAAGEEKGIFSAKNCLKEKIWNKYKKICKNC